MTNKYSEIKLIVRSNNNNNNKLLNSFRQKWNGKQINEKHSNWTRMTTYYKIFQKKNTFPMIFGGFYLLFLIYFVCGPSGFWLCFWWNWLTLKRKQNWWKPKYGFSPVFLYLIFRNLLLFLSLEVISNYPQYYYKHP